MLKKVLCIFVILVSQPVFARTNQEIVDSLYKTANAVEKESTVRADALRRNITRFIIEINMLKFDENTAVWKKLPGGYFYDSKSAQHGSLGYRGVYKSADNKMMGIFYLNCEDRNDLQGRLYGTLETTDVFFTTDRKTQRGRSLGLAQEFCK
jgi:hypothetical protein